MNRHFPDKTRDPQRGFSLLEILVAFSILALVLGILLQIFSKGLNLAATGEQYSRALLVAESLLATVGQSREIEVGENHGQADDLYQWSIDIRLYEDQDPGIANSQYLLYRVLVSVRFENRAVEFETLRVGSRV